MVANGAITPRYPARCALESDLILLGSEAEITQ